MTGEFWMTEKKFANWDGKGDCGFRGIPSDNVSRYIIKKPGESIQRLDHFILLHWDILMDETAS
jgi:hypothetical protein